ncbi:MAG: hypothetical protein IKB95_05715, partial [Bacteroidales bacterium]|nr:hypothetical protein [Bacteroidales bacterium]
DPFCPVCGNYPCTCNKKPHNGGSTANEPETPFSQPQPCPICGHLPCTCDGGSKPKNKVIVRLSDKRSLELKTTWTERFQFGDELISIEEFIKRLFGKLPHFFNGPEDLRKQWEHPDTRQALLSHLEREGFHEEKLQTIQRVMGREDCDLLDVLEYIAYETEPMERTKRVELVKQDYYKRQNAAQRVFTDFLISQYLRNSYREFTSDNLGKFINMKYGSIADAKANLAMDVPQIRNHYFEFQRQLYKAA